jgi:hypothetical protein
MYVYRWPAIQQNQKAAQPPMPTRKSSTTQHRFIPTQCILTTMSLDAQFNVQSPGVLCGPRQPKNPRPRNRCTHPGCTRPQAFVGDTCTRHRPARLAPPAAHHRGPAALLDEAHERLRRARQLTVRQPGLAQTDPPRRHASDAAEHLRILGMAEHQERNNDRSWELEKQRQERRAARADAGGGAADAEPPVLVGAMHRQGHPSLPDEEGSQLERTDNKPKDKKGKKGGTKKRRSKGKRRTRKRRSKRRRRTRR